MPDQLYLPTILLQIPRNPITAIGLPLALNFARAATVHNTVEGDWFQSLSTPPGRLSYDAFRVAWPIFYISLGYASHLAAEAIDHAASSVNTRNASLGLVVYYVHLGASIGWNALLFKFKRPGLAFANTGLMAVTALWMTKLWDGPTDHDATFCLVPYCAWMAYLTYLNAGVWWLNIGRRGPRKDDRDED